MLQILEPEECFFLVIPKIQEHMFLVVYHPRIPLTVHSRGKAQLAFHHFAYHKDAGLQLILFYEFEFELFPFSHSKFNALSHNAT